MFPDGVASNEWPGFCEKVIFWKLHQLSRWQRDQNASILSAPCLWIQIQNIQILRKKSCCLLQVCVYSARPPRLGSKWAAADYTSPTTMTTARNICGTVGPFPCEFGRFFFGINQHHRDPAHSRKDRSERGRHHAKGTRYVGELGFMATMLWASAAIWSSRLVGQVLPYNLILKS